MPHGFHHGVCLSSGSRSKQANKGKTFQRKGVARTCESKAGNSKTNQFVGMRYFSCFSGIGGFELGIQKAIPNSECVGFSEIKPNALKIYQKNFPNHKPYGDITKINTDELPDFDCLVGGFPCQAFSIAGKRRGFEDTRGTLFFELARILQAKKPRLFVFENVQGLIHHESGRTFKTIITTLDELGYDLQWQVLNSKNHGACQRRERVFIVGHIRGTRRPEVFPITQFSVVCKNPAVTLTARGYGSQRNGTYVVSHSKARKLTEIELERLQTFPNNWTGGLTFGAREELIGNAVTVNVIADIFYRLILSYE